MSFDYYDGFVPYSLYISIYQLVYIERKGWLVGDCDSLRVSTPTENISQYMLESTLVFLYFLFLILLFF